MVLSYVGRRFSKPFHRFCGEGGIEEGSPDLPPHLTRSIWGSGENCFIGRVILVQVAHAIWLLTVGSEIGEINGGGFNQ